MVLFFASLFRVHFSDVSFNPRCELRNINEYRILTGITFQAVLQSDADRNDATQVELLCLPENHSTSAIAIAHRSSVSEASTKGFVGSDLAEEVSI